MQTDVLIIGGGLAGLAAAVALSDRGVGVTVVERAARFGGRACSWRDDNSGDTIDVGPHILLSEYPNMLALLERLGTRGDIVWQTDKFLTVVEPRWTTTIRNYRLPAPLHSLPSLLHAQTVSVADMLSNRRALWAAMRLREADLLRLDAMSAEAYLRGLGVSQRFLDWHWSLTAMAILNLPLAQCSAGALMRFYQFMVSHNDINMGFPACPLADLFVPGALAAIEAAGGEVRLRTSAQALTVGDTGTLTGAVLDDGTRITARFVIAAVAPQDLTPILPAPLHDSSLARALPSLQPNPYISSYIWFDRKVTREPAWARTWSPSNLNYDSYDLSNIRRGWHERPSLIASNIIYSHRADAMSDDAIIAATIAELAEFVPAAAQARIRHARIHRIDMAIPCAFPGTEQTRPDVRTPLANFFIAGDWTRTRLPASMESAVRAGWLAAEAVLHEIGRPAQLTRAPRGPEGLARLAQTLRG